MISDTRFIKGPHTTFRDGWTAKNSSFGYYLLNEKFLVSNVNGILMFALLKNVTFPRELSLKAIPVISNKEKISPKPPMFTAPAARFALCLCPHSISDH